MKYLVSFLLIICSISAFAQNTPNAKNILDKAAATNNNYKTIISNFDYISSSTKTSDKSSEKGKVLIKGNKYHLIMEKNEIVSDGASVYNYSQGTNEVNITKPQPAKADKGDFFISNPKDIFTFYTKNFKYKWIKETDIAGQKCHEIDLYPVDLKTKYIRFTMHINQATSQIVDISLVYKNGDKQTITFSKFQANSTISDSEFIFDQKKYPGIVVNDLRF
jgi:outer membrane lipoprotein carrier protein